MDGADQKGPDKSLETADKLRRGGCAFKITPREDRGREVRVGDIEGIEIALGDLKQWRG